MKPVPEITAQDIASYEKIKNAIAYVKDELTSWDSTAASVYASFQKAEQEQQRKEKWFKTHFKRWWDNSKNVEKLKQELTITVEQTVAVHNRQQELKRRMNTARGYSYYRVLQDRTNESFLAELAEDYKRYMR